MYIEKVWFFLLFLIFPLSCMAATLKELPRAIIAGNNSQLHHPEGIAFSPITDDVAICSSHRDAILFFHCSDLNSSAEKIAPAFILGAPDTALGYPHDIDFSPDGEQLAIAYRRGNRVTIHQRDHLSGYYEQQPFALINGRDCALKGISAVKFSPLHNTLAVADVIGNKIALFRYSGSVYEPIPYQVISPQKFLLRGPDGIAFSRDGSFLAVTSHFTHAVMIFSLENSDGHYSSAPTKIIKGAATEFCYPHSVAFHPHDDTLVVSSAGGRHSVALFEKISLSPPYYSSTPTQILDIYNPDTIDLQAQYPEEGGVKGVCFSPSGGILGLCASDILDPTRSVQFFDIDSKQTSAL